MKLKNFFKTASNEIPRQMPDEPQKKGKLNIIEPLALILLFKYYVKKMV